MKLSLTSLNLYFLLLLIWLKVQNIISEDYEDEEGEQPENYVDYLLATHPELVQDKNRSYLNLGYDQAVVQVGHSDADPQAFYRFYNNDEKKPGDEVELQVKKSSVKDCKEC